MSATLRKAAEQAIATLMASTKYVEGCANARMVDGWGEHFDEVDKAINALRAALAEDDMSSGSNCKFPLCQTEEYQQMLCKEIAQSLALAEPEQSEPYIYYDPDTGETWTVGAIEDGCRYVDGLIALFDKPPRREPEQSEPVAWRKRMLPTDYDYDGNDWRFSESGFIEPEGQEPLYTHPPRREPLTEEQIADFLGDEYHSMTEAELRFFRLGEQAHGITGEKTKPLSDAEVTEAACSIDASLRAHLRDTGEKTCST